MWNSHGIEWNNNKSIISQLIPFIMGYTCVTVCGCYAIIFRYSALNHTCSYFIP